MGVSYFRYFSTGIDSTRDRMAIRSKRIGERQEHGTHKNTPSKTSHVDLSSSPGLC